MNGDKQVTSLIKKKSPPSSSVPKTPATFPVRTKDTKKNTEFAKSIKNTKDQQQRKLAPLPAVLDQPDCSYPYLHSYKIQAQDIESGVRKQFVTFIKDYLPPFKELFHPIIPSTNCCRMNYQSPQAVRVFMGNKIVHYQLHIVTLDQFMDLWQFYIQMVPIPFVTTRLCRLRKK